MSLFIYLFGLLGQRLVEESSLLLLSSSSTFWSESHEYVRGGEGGEEEEYDDGYRIIETIEIRWGEQMTDACIHFRSIIRRK